MDDHQSCLLRTSIPSKDEIDGGTERNVESLVAHEVSQLNLLYDPNLSLPIRLGKEIKNMCYDTGGEQEMTTHREVEHSPFSLRLLPVTPARRPATGLPASPRPRCLPLRSRWSRHPHVSVSRARTSPFSWRTGCTHRLPRGLNVSFPIE